MTTPNPNLDDQADGVREQREALAAARLTEVENVFEAPDTIRRSPRDRRDNPLPRVMLQEASKELLETSLRQMRENEQAQERQRVAAEQAQEQRRRLLAEAAEPMEAELNAVLAELKKRIPGIERMADRVEAATLAFSSTASAMGEMHPEQRYLRHPAHKLLPWLKLFERRD